MMFYNLQGPENMISFKRKIILKNIDNYIDNVDKITEVCNSIKKGFN